MDCDHHGVGSGSNVRRVYGDCLRQSGRVPESRGNPRVRDSQWRLREYGSFDPGADVRSDCGSNAGVAALSSALEGNAGHQRKACRVLHLSGDSDISDEFLERSNRHVFFSLRRICYLFEKCSRRGGLLRAWVPILWAASCGAWDSRWVVRPDTPSIQHAIWGRASHMPFCRSQGKVHRVGTTRQFPCLVRSLAERLRDYS